MLISGEFTQKDVFIPFEATKKTPYKFSLSRAMQEILVQGLILLSQLGVSPSFCCEPKS